MLQPMAGGRRENVVTAATVAQVLEDGVFYSAELARKAPVLQLARDVPKD